MEEIHGQEVGSADWILWSLNPESGLKIGSKSKKAHDATQERTIVVTAIKEQQIYVDIYSIWVWFCKDVVEDIWECRFTYRPMANMAKTEQGISVMFLIRWTSQEIWDMEKAEL